MVICSTVRLLMWHPSAAQPEPLTRGTRASHELVSLSINCGDGDVGGRCNEGDVLTDQASGMHKLHGDCRASQTTVDRLYQCHMCLENYFHSSELNTHIPKNRLLELQTLLPHEWSGTAWRTPFNTCHVVSK